MKVPTSDGFNPRLFSYDPLDPCCLISHYLRLNYLYLYRVKVILLVVFQTQLVIKAKTPAIKLWHQLVAHGKAMPASRMYILKFNFVFDEPPNGCGRIETVQVALA